jgi:hypothetical protein
MNKDIAIIFLLNILAFSGIALLNPSFAQTTKPIVPEFSLKYVEHPYDVSPIITVDPYTGKTITTQEGYHVKNASIELMIKNQQFSPCTDSKGNYVTLSYNVSMKGSFSDDWRYYPSSYWQIPSTASKTDYTLLTFSTSAGYNENDLRSFLFEIPSSGQIDFRVQASIGYYNETIISAPVPGGQDHRFTFVGESSGWSNTQTLILSGSSAATALPAETVEPFLNFDSSFEPVLQDWRFLTVLMVVVVFVVFGAGVVYVHRRKR